MEDRQFGAFDGMPNEKYHAAPGVSKSHLDVIAGRSPRHYWQRYINPEREPEEPTPALLIGTAVHSAILEPDDFLSRYVESPRFDRRTNAGRAAAAEFEADNAGKQVLGADTMALCIAMRDAVHSHPVAAPLLRNGVAERSFVAPDPDTGEIIKCRTDWYAPDRGFILDLKTCEDASPVAFGKSCANYRYTLQPAWYQDVIEAATGEAPPYWAFLAIEKSPPYAIGIYTPTAPQVAHGREVARRDFERIVKHRRANWWPDYGEIVLPLDLPPWMKL